MEVQDSGQVRIQKIENIIAECRFGIHDISRTDPDPDSKLPRFNMPLELGLFLGAKRYGNKRQRMKTCKILDLERFRFQKFCSDISGQDISAHNGDPNKAIKAVRDWLSSSKPRVLIPSGSKIAERYRQFQADLPMFCATFKLDSDELTFIDFQNVVVEWLGDNRW
ncbi:MAG: hypothetical protein WD688_20110 [Candidatus Binatia bacterium]